MREKRLLTTLVAYLITIFAFATETIPPEAKPSHKFIENVGQIDNEHAPADIRFYIQKGLMNVYFLEDRISYVLRNPDNKEEATRVDLSFGVNTNPLIYGLGGTKSNAKFYTLNCPAGAETMEYNKVVYEDIYENIDLVYYLSDEGALKYDFIVHPGGDPSDIEVNYTGDVGLDLLEDGRVELSTEVGKVYEAAPYTFIKENKSEVKSSYTLNNKQLKFKVSEYDETQTLVIDPEIEWSTFYGGESFDHGISSAVDRFGNVYITGKTYSLEFPNVSRDFGNGEKGDIFVGKFLADGTHVFTIYYGGDEESEGRGIATDDSGHAFVTGMTKSFFLPNPEDPGNPLEASGNEDIVLLRVDVDGRPVRVRTFGSFNGVDVGEGIEFDGNGLYLTGRTSTSETEFPVGPATHQMVKNQDLDAFLFRLDLDMNIIWSTYYGGTGGDEAYGVAVDSNGDPYIAGATNSMDLPFSSNPFTPGPTVEITDIFVAKFEKTTGQLLWSDYYGGTNSDYADDVVAYESDLIYVAGTTSSPDIEIINSDTTRTVQDTYGGGVTDGYIIQLEASTGAPRWSSFLGGSNDDHLKGLTITAGAEAMVTGYTESKDDFPTVNTDNAVRATFQGGEEDAIFALFSDAGDLRTSGYIGGSNIDVGRDVTFFRGETADDNNIYVIGRTRSADFPIAGNSYQSSYSGGADAFIYTIGAVIDTAEVIDTTIVGEIPTDTIPDVFCDAVRNNVISLNPLYSDIFGNECLENISDDEVLFFGSTPRIIGEAQAFNYLYQISPDGDEFQNVRDEDGNLAMSKNLTLGQTDLQRYFNLGDTLFVRRLVIAEACVDGSGTELIYKTDFQFAFPNFTFNANCQGQTVQLTDDSNITGGSVTSYQYIVTAGTEKDTFDTANPTVGPYSTEEITVELEITSDEGCVGVETKTINLLPAPQADFELTSNEQDVLCLGNTVTFTSTSTTEGDIVNYEWDLGNGTVVSGPDMDEVSTEYTTSGDKTIMLTITTSNGCTATASQTFDADAGQVVESPTVDAGEGETIQEGETISLNPTVNIPAGQELANSLWTSSPEGAFDPDPNNPNRIDPTRLNTGAMPDEDSYLTLMVETNLGCTAEDSLLVTVEAADVGGIPDIFTPNNDGFNDVFQIPFLKNFPTAKVEIFNRWGSLMYSTRNYFNNPWDGTYNGEPAPEGVYYYIISIPGRNEIKGSVTLVR
ncbi:MAG: gliding motility-associated C-terminal domain-containing protein [Candidatus Cyclobacteriaceae bacterium M2_1C_046]